jgi:hypothetical protein
MGGDCRTGGEDRVFHRPCGPRAISEDDAVWLDVGCSVLRHTGRGCECWVDRHVEGAFGDRLGFECAGGGVHYEGRPCDRSEKTFMTLIGGNVQIDMTPPNVQAETVKQVVKILRSPGCRKTPVFVRSKEVAVEIAQAYAKDR